MQKHSHLLFATMLAGAQFAAASPVHAVSAAAVSPASVAIPMQEAPAPCLAVKPDAGTVSASLAAVPLSKSAAIVGASLSRLELIARQQAGEGAMTGSRSALPGEGLAPALGPISCASLVQARNAMAQYQPGLRSTLPNDDNFLASKRLPIRRTSFDGAWSRVKRAALPSRLARSLAGIGTGQSGVNRLAAVNSWANAKIRYVEDQELYGKADYWASAGATLRMGAGDCEDIAIVKMQLLAAMGVSQSDMYLTIARDLARNADHAVLVVRAEGRHWLLDNATSALLDASQSYDYRPIMSFSTSKRWLHGY